MIAMQLLTHENMLEIEELRKNSKFKFDIIIKDSSIYIRFHTSTNFDIDSINNKKKIKEYYDFFKLVYALSKKIVKVVEDLEI